MIVYKNYTSYKILNVDVNIISDQTDYGRNTVAEISDKYFYLGTLSDDILAAVFAWELFSGKKVSDEEFATILDNNDINLVFMDLDTKNNDD